MSHDMLSLADESS